MMDMIDRVTRFRKDMHAHPELAFQEVETARKVRAFLTTEIGIPEDLIRPCAGTGFVVDLWGRAAPAGARRLVAFRADMDALPIQEETGLPYQSQNKSGHMCGHDGHTATLLYMASKWWSTIDKVPSDRGIRLLFQPS
jgi:metal-dependent amidase/aminoacylase/carboxypeptidase family protein